MYYISATDLYESPLPQNIKVSSKNYTENQCKILFTIDNFQKPKEWFMEDEYFERLKENSKLYNSIFPRDFVQ